MNFRRLCFECDIKKFDKIVCYGTGSTAREVFKLIDSLNRRIDYFITTVGDDPYPNDEYETFSLDEKAEEIKNEKALVLIAALGENEERIKSNIIRAGIIRYIRVSDYIRFTQGVNERFENILEKTLLSCIAEWKTDLIEGEYSDFLRIKEEIENARPQDPEKNRICFVVGDLSPRVNKIAGALVSKGYEITVVYTPNAGIAKEFEEQIDNLDLETIRTHCFEELIYEIIRIRASLIHLFAGWSDHDNPYLLIRNKGVLPPIVYDKYDVVAFYKYYSNNDYIEREKYCFEHADGLCYRGNHDGFLRKNGYKIKGKSLRFFDYCSDKEVERIENENELHLAYVGGIVTEDSYPNGQGGFWLSFAEMCYDNHCHLHLYPVRWSEELQLYDEISLKNQYFHLHHPLPVDKLIESLSKHDFGIFPTDVTIYFRTFRSDDSDYNKDAAAQNKIFDYLDAGLATIGVIPFNLLEYLDEYGVVIHWCIEEINFEYLREHKEEYRKKAICAQKELQISNHISKLESFYSEVCKEV